MINYYKVITSNHLLTNVNNLGKYMVGEDHKSTLLLKLKEGFGVSELLYLSTCNRVAYLLYTNQAIDTNYLIRFLSFLNPDADESELEVLMNDVALYEGLDAVRHLMEVAGSIDSMVVGEREIFRQFREAYNYCSSEQLTGDNIRLLEKKVVEIAKSIHTNTRIGEKPLSIAALAMTSILDEVDVAKNNKLLFIGAGETNTLMAKLLKPKQVGTYTIYNRTIANAKKLATELKGKAKDLTRLGRDYDDFDVMVICTSSQTPIINKAMLSKMVNSTDRKRIVVDLSIPSNIDQDILEVPNILYINIDHLKELSQLNLEHRKKEIVLAKTIIDGAIQSFANTYQERKLEIALSDVPKEIRKVKEKALNEVYKKRLATLNPNALELLSEMMDYMEKKCVSIPMKAAKKKIL